MRSLHGVFEPKSPLDNPVLAALDTSFYGIEHDRANLKNDMAIFGSDFKKVTKKAKKEMNIE
jgi:hypothetical protein